MVGLICICVIDGPVVEFVCRRRKSGIWEVVSWCFVTLEKLYIEIYCNERGQSDFVDIDYFFIGLIYIGVLDGPEVEFVSRRRKSGLWEVVSWCFVIIGKLYIEIYYNESGPSDSVDIEYFFIFIYLFINIIIYIF